MAGHVRARVGRTAALLLAAWVCVPATLHAQAQPDAMPADPFQITPEAAPPAPKPPTPAAQATPEPAEPDQAPAAPEPTAQPAPDPQPEPEQTAEPAAPAPEPPPAVAPPITVTAPPPDSPVPEPAEAPAAEPSPAPPGEAAAAPQPVALDHPTVVDTATLEDNTQTLRLFGISGLSGASAEGLKSYIAAAGDRVTCQPRNAEFVCVMADGTDIALVALVNGAAEARADAPEAYRDQQLQAQQARRGIWSSLPPPPAEVKHPALQDTATLSADGQVFALDGVQGVGGDYARKMQGYIAANGDSLLCQPQGSDGFFVCLLPDGTDVAKVALVNGAARVSADAPDAYRAQQADAMANHRGIWANAAPAELVLPPPAYVTIPDEPPDGIFYVDGTPTAVIDGATVAFAFADGAGWGYYDHDHEWHGAPGRYGAHLDRYHPGGAGLRGYATRASTGHGAFADVHAAPGRPIGTPPAALHQTAAHGVAGGLPTTLAPARAGVGAPPAVNRPIGGTPLAAGHPSPGHPLPAQAVPARQVVPSVQRPANPAPAFHPAPTPRPMAAASPFMRPAPGNFRPPNPAHAVAMPQLPRAAPAPRAAPPPRVCKGKC